MWGRIGGRLWFGTPLASLPRDVIPLYPVMPELNIETFRA